MCGITGVASTGLLIEQDKKFFRSALHCDQLRGVDSTGVFTVSKDDVPDVQIFKKAYPAADFLQMRRTNKIIDTLGTVRCIVGHNRAATKGSVNNYNAHPFQCGDITMVHNGTLSNYATLPGYNYNTNDSRLLCRGIAELGIQEAINRISGAWSLVWHDAADNTLNFLRNDQRPMALASNEGRKDLYFASEFMMLDWITARHGIKITELLDTQVDQHIKLALDAPAFDPVIQEVKKISTFIVGGNISKKLQSERRNVKQNSQKPDGKVKARDTLLAEKLTEVDKDGDPVPDIGVVTLGYFWEMDEYPSRKGLGVMRGTMMDDPFLVCELHNQKVAAFTEGYYDFRVCARRLDGTINNDIELLGHSPVLIGVEDLAKREIHVPAEQVIQELVKKEEAAAKKLPVLPQPNPWTREQLRLEKQKQKLLNSKTDLRASTQHILTASTTNGRCSVLTNIKPAVTAQIIQLGNKHSSRWKDQQKKLQARKLLDKNVGQTIKDTLSLRNASSRPAADVDKDYPYFGFGGVALSQKVFDDITKHGCCKCTGPIQDDDAPDLRWLDVMSPVCLACQAEEEYGHSMGDDLPNHPKMH